MRFTSFAIVVLLSAGLLSSGWSIPEPDNLLDGSVEILDPRICDLSSMDSAYELVFIDMELAFTIVQDLSGRLVGQGILMDPDSGRALSMPLTGRLSVRNTSPLVFQLSGSGRFLGQRVSVQIVGSGDVDNMQINATARWGTKREGVGTNLPLHNTDEGIDFMAFLVTDIPTAAGLHGTCSGFFAGSDQPLADTWRIGTVPRSSTLVNVTFTAGSPLINALVKGSFDSGLGGSISSTIVNTRFGRMIVDPEDVEFDLELFH